jgi:tetratricopeptide (TPR) repeat protein
MRRRAATTELGHRRPVARPSRMDGRMVTGVKASSITPNRSEHLGRQNDAKRHMYAILSNMPRGSVVPSLEVSRLLRERRKGLNLSLSEVARRLAQTGTPIPHSTLVRIEQGKLDPGVRRLHQLLRLYEIPPDLVADFVDVETMASREAIEGDDDSLHERAIALWRAGDLQRGLAYFFELRRRLSAGPDRQSQRQRATLGFAVAARDLGKFRLAKSLIDELLLDAPSTELTIKAFVLAASVWEGLGSLDVALAFIRDAVSRAASAGAEVGALVAHQEAKLLVKGGHLEDASRALERAVAHYRSLGDTYGEARAAVLRVRIVERSQGAHKAVAAARDLIAFAERHGQAKLGLTGQLELGRLLTASGDHERGLEHLRKALGQAVLMEDRNARLLAHHHLWKAYSVSGDRARAQVEFDSARSLVRFVDDGSDEADEIRALKTLGGSSDA